MPRTKLYGDVQEYERKLIRVMERLSVDVKSLKYDWSRFEAWVEFIYKGQPYRFHQSVDNARKHGIKLNYGTDAFSQVVLSLEDIARMVERGIYDLSTWIAGMKFLPSTSERYPERIQNALNVFGFESMPASGTEVQKRFVELVKTRHPDGGGSDSEFIMLHTAKRDLIDWMDGGSNS